MSLPNGLPNRKPAKDVSRIISVVHVEANGPSSFSMLPLLPLPRTLPFLAFFASRRRLSGFGASATLRETGFSSRQGPKDGSIGGVANEDRMGPILVPVRPCPLGGRAGCCVAYAAGMRQSRISVAAGSRWWRVGDGFVTGDCGQPPDAPFTP